MKFLIWAFDYNWKIGGIIVLHKLSELLAKEGFDTFVLSETTNKRNRAKLISESEATRLAQDPQMIVIYPEVVIGNPLNAHNVARWVLYFPGVNGGDREFAESEFVFTFNSSFVSGTRYSDAPQIRIIDTMREQFFDLNKLRTKDAILVKKGWDGADERRTRFIEPHLSEGNPLEIISIDDLIFNCDNLEEYNLALNEIRYFMSFDLFTYHNILASLSGCISIVVPAIDISREEYFDLNPGLKNGVAYGLRDLDHQKTTRDQLLSELKSTESKNVDSLKYLLNQLGEFFDCDVNKKKFGNQLWKFVSRS